MTTSNFSSIRAASGRVTAGLFAAMVLTLLLPGTVAAQCVTCGWDYQEDTIECMDYLVGANYCIFGSLGDDEEFCFTWGGQCEWIVHLEFSEHGAAYVQRDPSPSADEKSSASVSQTCDGVLLDAKEATDAYALRDALLSLEI